MFPEHLWQVSPLCSAYCWWPAVLLMDGALFVGSLKLPLGDLGFQAVVLYTNSPAQLSRDASHGLVFSSYFFPINS